MALYSLLPMPQGEDMGKKPVLDELKVEYLKCVAKGLGAQ